MEWWANGMVGQWHGGPKKSCRPLARRLELCIDEGVLLAPGDAFGSAFADHARRAIDQLGE